MIKGNFLGAAIIAIIYTIYLLKNLPPTRLQTAFILVVLNALTIVLMFFAFKDKTMIKGNFLGAAIIAIIYTIFIILKNPLATRLQTASILVVLNALTIVLMSFAFKL
jgi:hypothetical protein